VQIKTSVLLLLLLLLMMMIIIKAIWHLSSRDNKHGFTPAVEANSTYLRFYVF
jgi:hypothetical protein